MAEVTGSADGWRSTRYAARRFRVTWMSANRVTADTSRRWSAVRGAGVRR
jgi:hypothetical protein